MPQFDVHRNEARNRARIPCYVVVQTKRLDGLPSRLVVPLAIPDPATVVDARLAPRFEIEGRELVLLAWQMFAVPRTALGRIVGSLADDDAAVAIIGAIDEVISRAYR